MKTILSMTGTSAAVRKANQHGLFGLGLSVVLCSAGLAACGGDTNSVVGNADAGVSTGGKPGTGGTDAGTQADGVAPIRCGSPVDAGYSCNNLVNTAELVDLSAATGTLPTGVGGPVLDGLYHLTKQVYYPGSQLTGTMLRSAETVLVCGNRTQHVKATVDPARSQFGDEAHASGAFSTTGTAFTMTPTCGYLPAIEWSSYTATTTTLSVYSTSLGLEVVFTRQ